MNTLSPQANQHILIFLLSSIGLIALPHFYNLPVAILGFFYALLAWRFVGIWRPQWLPNRLLVFLLTVGGIALLYSQHQGMFGRNAGTMLFVTALGLKLMEMYKERDLYLVTYLAFVVAASQFLYQQNVAMAAYIVLVCCSLLATLVCLNSYQPRTVAALKTAAVIMLQAIPLAAVVFVLFPRLEAPRWMLFNDDQKGKMGLSETMEAGTISDLVQSDDLVFRVTFNGEIPPPKQRYWRGPVLALTDGKRWMQTNNSLYNLSVKPQVDGTAYAYTLLIEAQNKNWVFALDMPYEFAAPLRQNANYQLISLAESNKRTEYKITSYAQYNTGAIKDKEYTEALQLPDQASERITQLVRQLHGFNSPPEQFIKALLTHFHTEKFYYSLTPPLMLINPIETFLFETRTGFCSHYASSFVYLMRVAHIPARVVMGYQGGELNKLGNFLEIRQSDAHAWAEVWLENRGWVRVDPTAAVAPERIEQGNSNVQISRDGLLSFASDGASTAFSWFKDVRQLWRNVDYRWQRWVINYNGANQSKFLSSFGIKDVQAMLRWLLILAGIVAALSTGFLLMQKRKASDKVLRVYQRFTKKLSKLGLIKASTEGAKDFAERAKLQLPERADEISQITEAFIALRYGKNPSTQALKKLQQQVMRFKV